MSTDLPCFKEARNAWKAGAIELDEFLRHIVAHYGGLRHEADVEGQRPYLSASFEDEVRKLVLNEKFLPLNDDGKIPPPASKLTLDAMLTMWTRRSCDSQHFPEWISG